MLKIALAWHQVGLLAFVRRLQLSDALLILLLAATPFLPFWDGDWEGGVSERGTLVQSKKC